MIKCHLSRLMGEKIFSITEVAKVTGMSNTTVSNLYNEKVKRLDFYTLEKLCKIFNSKVEDLIEYIPDEE